MDEKELATTYMETTVGIVTAPNPILGYEKATELAQKKLYQSGKGNPRDHKGAARSGPEAQIKESPLIQSSLQIWTGATLPKQIKWSLHERCVDEAALERGVMEKLHMPDDL